MKVTAFSLAIILTSSTTALAFNTLPAIRTTSLFKTASKVTTQKSTSLFPPPRKSNVGIAAATALSPPEDGSEKQGLFTFKTKYGYINPFGIYYGVTAILLGLPWFVELLFCQLLYKLTNSKFDKLKRLPSFFSQVWGELLLRLTRSLPKVENQEMLNNFYKEDRAAMFVANHNSWMDIPFVGSTLGWRNYKLISKAELGKVPILGRSIRVGGHVMVDRTNRRSQIMTLKNGMKWLQDGVHLCTFPEGTRSKTGRMLPFKNGAFKMAHKVGAPVIPLSIVAAGKTHPANFMFPRSASRKICKVIVHEPIESNDKTEAELAQLVREAIINGLPEDQKPLDEETQ